MKNIKRTLACILSAIAMLSIIYILAGCVNDDDNNKTKYRLNVMIVKEDDSGVLTGDKWIVATNEIDIYESYGRTRFSIEQEYDGRKYKYYVCAYNLPDHPEFSDIWFRYYRPSYVEFVHHKFYRDFNGMSAGPYSAISEKGEYKMYIFATETELWNGHQIELIVNII